MEKKPTLFSYKGETLIILPGHLLDKNELIQRLRTIDFLAINSSYNKNDLVYIYEIALTYDNNKLKLYNKLKKDTEYYYARMNLQRRNNNDSNEKTYNFTPKKYFFSNEKKNNIIHNYDDKDEKDFTESSDSSSFCRRVLQFINNHKIDILEKLFYLFIIFSLDAFIKNFAKNHYFLGKLLMGFRNRVTPRRIILGFLFYYIVKYILNTLFYYLFGIGFLGIMYLIFKDKIKDFLNL